MKKYMIKCTTKGGKTKFISWYISNEKTISWTTGGIETAKIFIGTEARAVLRSLRDSKMYEIVELTEAV